MLNKLGVAKDPSELMALHSTSPEYFLFPMPTPEEHFIFHPLLIERTGLPQQVRGVKFTLPALPIVPEESLRVAPEEVLTEDVLP